VAVLETPLPHIGPLVPPQAPLQHPFAGRPPVIGPSQVWDGDVWVKDARRLVRSQPPDSLYSVFQFFLSLPPNRAQLFGAPTGRAVVGEGLAWYETKGVAPVLHVGHCCATLESSAF
jgi:hypothetical protein